MLLWFAGLAFVSVVLVFGSAAVDYRLVMFGATVPSAELIWGGPWVMHTLVFPAATMAVIMIAATGKRLVQRRWLGLAIGLLLHLVFDGTWRLTSLFWWPAFGWNLDSADVPSLPPLAITILMEVLGALVLAWAWRRFGMQDPARRDRFVRTGQLDRALMTSEPPTC